MTTVERLPVSDRVVLYGIPWKLYVALRDNPENYHVRMTYDRGELEMLSPSMPHERFVELLNRLIWVWTEELDIAVLSCGMMTCRRKDLKKGFEPDKCYYVKHAARMRGKEELDLASDPAPDLAIEVEVSRSSRSKMELYEAFRVPELWRYDGETIQVYLLADNGRYAPQSVSRVFSGFPLSEAERVLSQLNTADDTALAKSFRQWVQANART